MFFLLPLLCGVLCTPFEFEHRPPEEVLREYRRTGHPTLLVLQQGSPLEEDVLFVKDMQQMDEMDMFGIRTKYIEVGNTLPSLYLAVMKNFAWIKKKRRRSIYLITMKECIRIKENKLSEVASTCEYYLDGRKYRNRVYAADRTDMSDMVRKKLSAVVFFNNEERTGESVESAIRKTHAAFEGNRVELPVWRYDGEADTDVLPEMDFSKPQALIFICGQPFCSPGDLYSTDSMSFYSKAVFCCGSRNQVKKTEEGAVSPRAFAFEELIPVDATAIVVFTDRKGDQKRASRMLGKAKRIEELLKKHAQETQIFDIEKGFPSRTKNIGFERACGRRIFLCREGVQYSFAEERAEKEIVGIWKGLGMLRSKKEHREAVMEGKERIRQIMRIIKRKAHEEREREQEEEARASVVSPRGLHQTHRAHIRL
ncbi:MAG: uncharacterized protein A8A55_2270 [Amphiamblys sp. WSBS2006]|nr:MAG: uncharacterized protein A8A55_2270 [Amphiamblys sp. WSBS2006]